MIDRNTFLATIFEDRNDDEMICVSKMIPADNVNDKPGFWNVPSTHGVFRKWKPETQEAAWYFCVSTMQEEWNERETAIKRKRDNIRYIYCVVFDDIGTKAAPPPVEPSWKIETSEGNFQWGYMIEKTDDIETHEAFTAWGADQGWGDAGAGGSYRIMRLPGSYNLKPGRGLFQSRVTYWEPVVWTLGELIQDFGNPELGSYVSRSTVSRSKVSHGPDFDPLLSWLKDRGHVLSDNGDEFVEVVCPWSHEHTDGNNVASYSPLGRGTEQWSMFRTFNCFHEHCKDRDYDDFIEAHQRSGAPFAPKYDPMPYLQDRYALIVDGQEVVDLHQRPKGGLWVYDLNDWALLYPGKVRVPYAENPVPIKSAFIADGNTRKPITSAYVPNADAIVEQHGQMVVNKYVEPNWPETDDEPATFLEHVAFLLPDDIERRCFLDWLAYKVQNPSSRSYAVLMVAKGHGTGRGNLRQRITRMLQGKVNTASFPQLIGRGTAAEQNYNDWVSRCQFVVVEEAKDNMEAQDFYHGYETFKSLVDTRVVPVRVNPKFGRTRDDHAYFNALIFSNHTDALVIPEGDRRIAVFTNPDTRREKEYYDRIEGGDTDKEAAALYWWLKRRDVSNFDHVYPPDTEAKRDMISMGRSNGDNIEDEVLAGCQGDLVTQSILVEKIRQVANANGDRDIAAKPENLKRRIWRRLKSLRPEAKNGARYSLNGTQNEVRAIQNLGKWREVDQARDTDTIVKEVMKNETNVISLVQTGN